MSKDKLYDSMVLDARPDRMDLRDREYRPHLSSLPIEYPAQKDIRNFTESYTDNDLILDQGKEGACTGFGLAATINYLIWRDEVSAKLQAFRSEQQPLDENGQAAVFDCSCVDIKAASVSPHMLYHMARIYDEWDGEDYSGSSCRGAMKGWHRHGVCKQSLWGTGETDVKTISPATAAKAESLPKTAKDFPWAGKSWETDALSTTLGAYYRINHKSVVDMQAAISEVGAIYCSAKVHKGWQVGEAVQKKSSDPDYGHTLLPVMEISDEMIGGHAFCLIGYNQQGFIVQNSWGPKWGWNGFAILQYADWVENGSDAWVVSRGVPIKTGVAAPQMYANNALQDVATHRKDPKMGAINKALQYAYDANFKAKPWSEDRAYEHALVISNNGRPKQTVIAARDADASAKHICEDNLKAWLKISKKNRKIVIYAHGGLNNEESSINRVRVMAPYFEANGIYPLFVIWKTGFLETISHVISDEGNDLAPAESGRAEGFFSDITDRAIETIARNVMVKSLWSEMKENAVYASDRAVPGFAQNRSGKPGAMVILAQAIEKLSKNHPDIEVHLAGHSAGSILLGAWLDEITKRKLKVKTVSLLAPACTIAFANKHYRKAMQNGIFSKKDLYIHNMDDEREKSDTVGKVYRKSLLYLVSRALEKVHKMPILGLADSWDVEKCTEKKSDGFNYEQRSEVDKWYKFMQDGNAPIIYSREKSQVKINLSPDYIDLSHGSFDNDINVVEHTIKKIRGDNKLIVHVVNLCGY